MLKRVLHFAETRTRWFLQSQELRRVSDMSQFEDFVTRTQPAQFLRCRDMSGRRRSEFQAMINALGINLKGIRFLDIGSAYGDALDVCHEHGAELISYIEPDPVLYTHNALKPYAHGLRSTHPLGFDAFRPQQFDLIWVKGGVKADTVMRLGKASCVVTWWLRRLEHLASPSCRILISPDWESGSEVAFRRVQNTAFSAAMRACGYFKLPPLQPHADPAEQSITFYKDISFQAVDGPIMRLISVLATRRAIRMSLARG